jgi:hypothetical protein
LEDLEENGSLGFIFLQKIRISPDIAGQIICIASRLCSYSDFILNPFILRSEKMRGVRQSDLFSWYPLRMWHCRSFQGLSASIHFLGVRAIPSNMVNFSDNWNDCKNWEKGLSSKSNRWCSAFCTQVRNRIVFQIESLILGQLSIYRSRKCWMPLRNPEKSLWTNILDWRHWITNWIECLLSKI